MRHRLQEKKFLPTLAALTALGLGGAHGATTHDQYNFGTPAIEQGAAEMDPAYATVVMFLLQIKEELELSKTPATSSATGSSFKRTSGAFSSKRSTSGRARVRPPAAGAAIWSPPTTPGRLSGWLDEMYRI
jgi:hypothetical protein